ncbi:lipocalin family protein [Fluviicola sp.]|uniref:lipocalin family protein n=1 Tax=Fluviicola sp. TaxID=1917219 RepID=UPI00262EB016|nr:lipocalin family protein [Fluviicola sp.]
MKTLLPCILSFLFFVSACSETEKAEELQNKKEPSVVGSWELIKRRDANNQEKSFKGSPANIIVSIEKTGYFHIYDTLKNEKWLSGGDLHSIQTRRIGQWTYKDSTLNFMYQDKDSSYPENIVITKLTENEMVMKRNKNKFTTFSYFKRNS